MVVPGGRFCRLDRCGMPLGGVTGSVPAACTVASRRRRPSGAGRQDRGAGAGGGTAGSANAAGALKVRAATIPSAPDVTVSAIVSISIRTNAPFPLPL